MVRGCLALWLGISALAAGQSYGPSREKVPTVAREFRAAWVACVYNIDWPSRKGLSAGSQQAELRRILDKLASLKMNAIIFQVRPQADAVYKSRIEPWSPWLTGTMGRSPGYDPLAYCIQQAHARNIEVHAWFNPFRAVPHKDHAVSSDHVSRTHPSVIRNFKVHKWMDPSSSFTRDRAINVIMDVVRRYDVDGIHIDDYFYPYPDIRNGRATPTFPDGKSPSQRRSYVNSFVKSMYSNVKRSKPWVRVGISPFGIWKPGVPRGTTAGINAYEHLAADSRKWLSSGWCDYLSPQLYWRIEGPQSYSLLLSWWRAQGRRPVWPGIATSRIKSSEDPGRPASEIINQIQLSRTTGRNYVGHVHWSAKALMQNRGGVSSSLAKSIYTQPALVPPMPWLSKKGPPTPAASAQRGKSGTSVRWSRVAGAAKYAVQARYGQTWVMAAVVHGGQSSVTVSGTPDAIAVSAVDRYGTTSAPAVLGRR
ncbi:MAG: glycoside hydrolase family 10 protein [Roseibacillus sp.]